MMKKLLVLLMVLGITSIASAAIELSVDSILGVDEISILPSDTIIIDVYNAGNSLAEYGQIDFDYYLDFYDPAEGLYSLGTWQLGPAAGDSGDFPSGLKDDSTYTGYQELTIGQNWAIGSEEIIGVMGQLELHCEGLGDVYVEVWDARDLSGPMDTLTIHQVPVPEPITIALLGLGGLFLRRRK
jgi:hypothetical protein